MTRPSRNEIYKVAVKITSRDARQAYLEQVCGDDSALFLDVNKLLAKTPHEASELAPTELPPTIGPDDSGHGPAVGQTVGPYKLLQKIGEGGFGVVYVAEQSAPVRRKVAFKLIKRGMDTREVVEFGNFFSFKGIYESQGDLAHS